MARPIKNKLEDHTNEHRKFALQREDLYDREEIAEDAESSVPYGSDEVKSATKGYQPRSRINNSRGMQFRSREERNAHFMRTAQAQFLGKTYIPRTLLDTGDFYMWACKSIRDQPQDANMRRLEQKGFEPVWADECPELAMWDYNGQAQDSSNFVEGGGLQLLVLDKDLHAFEQKFHDEARRKQQIMRDNLNAPEPDKLRSPRAGARMHY